MRGNWIFPSTDGGEVQGLNNTGIEQFSDNAIRSLAREIYDACSSKGWMNFCRAFTLQNVSVA